MRCIMTTKTAMILAAGRGERMRPLTDSTPKPLLTVKNKALIEYHIDNLVLAGYQRIVINHAWLGEQIVTAIGDGRRYGCAILYSKEQQALETAGGIIQALPLLCQSESEHTFTVVNGDIYTDFAFDALPETLAPGQGHLVMVNNPQHNPCGDFALDAGYLASEGRRKLTFSGIARYHRTFFSSQQSGVQPLAPMLRSAMRDKAVTGQAFFGHWIDVGTPERLNSLNELA